VRLLITTGPFHSLRREVGQPSTVIMGTDQALNGFQGNTGTQRPNQILILLW
jgi:hypothetical protein